MGWEFGLAQWTKLQKAGSKQTAVENHCRRSSSLENRERHTSAGSQRMMIASSTSSHTNWNTQADIRRRTQQASRESCCQTFSPMIFAARYPFRTMGGH